MYGIAWLLAEIYKCERIARKWIKEDATLRVAGFFQQPSNTQTINITDNTPVPLVF